MQYRKTKRLFAILSILLIFPCLAYAQEGGFVVENPEDSGLFDQIFGCRFYEGAMCILEKVLVFLLSIAFIIALIFLVFGGYRYVTARGNDEAVADAKKIMSRAVIGVIVIAAAWAILRIILGFIEG